MLTTPAPTHHHRWLRAGAVLAAFGLGLPVGMAPALAETLTAAAQVEVKASAIADADTALPPDAAAGAVANGTLALDLAGAGGGGGDGEGDGEISPALPGLSLDGDFPLVGGVVSNDEPGELGAEVLGRLPSGDGDSGLPGLGFPGLSFPGLSLPGPGLPGFGHPGLGLPGPGLSSLPDRLPSLVLPSLITAPSGQDDDPPVLNAGHVRPVGGPVNGTGGSIGEGPAPESGAVPGDRSNGGPAQLGGASTDSLPRTGANLQLRAVAAFGLLGLAGLGGRRRRSA